MRHLVTNANCKILSMVLAIALIISMLPVTAFAEAAPDDNTYATSGVMVSGKEDDPAPATTGDLLLDDGGDETCVCTAFQSDADCPICRDDYTSCVQAVEVPEIMPLAAVDMNHDISENNLVITNADYHYIINGTTTTNTITVNGDLTNVNITLNGVNIDVSGTSDTCAFDIEPGAIVNLTLEGTNILKSGSHAAGLHVPDGAMLTITAESTGGSVKINNVTGAASNAIPQATNGSVPVYRSTLMRAGVTTAGTKITGITAPSGYGITDVYTDLPVVLILCHYSQRTTKFANWLVR